MTHCSGLCQTAPCLGTCISDKSQRKRRRKNLRDGSHLSSNDVKVRDALLRYTNQHNVQVRYRTPVEALLMDPEGTDTQPNAGRVQGVRLRDGKQIMASAIILATGGASWPSTGSTGDGYRMAQTIGHSIIPLRPALVPLTVAERARAKALQGISLRNIHCTLLAQQAKGTHYKPIPPRYPLPPTGELLFTHFGLSGPLVLTRSLDAVDALRAGKQVFASIDLKPGMTADEIRIRLQREFEQHAHKHLANLLQNWAPHALATVLAEMSGIAPERPVHTIRAEERDSIVERFKDFRWQITSSLPLEAGMVTAGGVSLKEVDPRSFASRKVHGLFLAGEVLDLAGDTGGFNLQAAFSSGYLAGEHAAALTSAL